MRKSRDQLVRYYVEGQCEKKLIDTYKTKPEFVFCPGKVEVFNVVNEKLSKARLLALDRGTTIVLVYDTDVKETGTLEENLRLFNLAGLKQIYHVQSLKNFEEELLFSTDCNKINDFFHTEGREEFKKQFIKHSDIRTKLASVGFKPENMWSRLNTEEPFKQYASQEALNFIKNK